MAKELIDMDPEKRGKDDEADTLLSKRNELSFEDAFELTGHGCFNHCVLLTCGLIMLNVSMESVGMSYVITAAQCELNLTSKQKGLVNAAAFIGIIATSFLWGYLGDRFGRRSVMLPAILASALVSVVSSLANNVWTLLCLRILTGCLISASSATVYAYLGEMHISSRRAVAIAWGSAFISFSFIILPGFAWIIIPNKWSWSVLGFRISSWRMFMWSWCAPGLLAAAALQLLPESPRYLLVSEGPEKALPVLAKMHRWNHFNSTEKFLVEKIRTEGEFTPRGGFVGALRNITLMFQPPLLRCVIISHLSMFAVFMLASGLYVWVPDILNSVLHDVVLSVNEKPSLLQQSDVSSAGANATSRHQISICEVIHNKFQARKVESTSSSGCGEMSVLVYPISMFMGVVFAITYLAIGVFINRIGRKTLYIGIMVACGAATLGAGLVPHGVAATALLVLALCAGCAASILAAIAVDVFPTSLRAMAMCVMYMVGRAGAAAGSNLLGAMLDSQCEAAFAVFGLFSAGSTLLMIFWPKPEKVREEMERKGLSY